VGCWGRGVASASRGLEWPHGGRCRVGRQILSLVASLAGLARAGAGCRVGVRRGRYRVGARSARLASAGGRVGVPRCMRMMRERGVGPL
jgi:hypothetical protein